MMDVTMPDGTVVQGVPEGTTKAQLMAKYSGYQAGQAGGSGAAFGESLANGVPFGGRISSAIGALGAAAMGAGNVGDLYNQAQANTAATAAAHPDAALAGTVTGILPTLALGGGAAKWAAAPTFSGSAALPRLGNIIGQSVKGAAVAAPVGAVYSAGDAPTVQDMPQAAAQGAKVMGAIGAALPVAGATLGGAATAATGLGARIGGKLDAAGDAMYSDAGGIYNKMREAGAILNPQSSSDLSSSINGALNTPHFIPELNPKTTAIVGKINNVIANNGEISLGDLDQYRRLLGRFGSEEDGVSANAVRQALDTHVNSLTGNDMVNGDASAVDLLNQGRAHYTQASKFDDIAGIVQRSAGDATKLKTALTKFLNNSDNTKGWTDTEKAVLTEAARSGTAENIMKGLGRFGISPGNVFLPLVSGGVTGGLAAAGIGGAGALGAGIFGAGMVARPLARLIARGKAENLLQTIERGVPSPSLNSRIPYPVSSSAFEPPIYQRQ